MWDKVSALKSVFFTKKTVWKLKWWVKITLLVGILVGILSGVKVILPYSFKYLAIRKTVASPYEVAVVEGWISDAQITTAAHIIMKNAISQVVVTGSKLEFCTEFMPVDHYAALGTLRLLKSGVQKANILEVVNEESKKFRTYECAKGVKDILDRLSYRRIMIFTSAPHARRTLATYEKVFDSQYDIGVFPLDIEGISCENWWESSFGVKKVLEEYIGYVIYCFYGKAVIL